MTFHILERDLRQKQKDKQTVPFFTQLQFLKPLFLQEQGKTAVSPSCHLGTKRFSWRVHPHNAGSGKWTLSIDSCHKYPAW